MGKRITVTIGPDGNIVAESSGVAGPACLDDLALITALCDTAAVAESKLTPEYYASVHADDSTYIAQQQTVRDE
jgi:hypothetical protein